MSEPVIAIEPSGERLSITLNLSLGAWQEALLSLRAYGQFQVYDNTLRATITLKSTTFKEVPK